MFRAPLYPSSGARQSYTSGCCLSYLVLWFSSCRYGVELRVVCPVCIPTVKKNALDSYVNKNFALFFFLDCVGNSPPWRTRISSVNDYERPSHARTDCTSELPILLFFFQKLSSYVFVILSFLSYFFFHFSVSSFDVFYLFLSIVLSFLPFSRTNIRSEDSESLLEIKTRKIKADETSRKLSVILISSFFFVLVLYFVPISLPSLRLLCYLLNHRLFTQSRWV